MTADLERHEPVAEGRPEDPVPPRHAIAFEWDTETTAELDRTHLSVGQVVLYMVPKYQDAQPVDPGNDCLVLRIDEILPLARYLVDAYAGRMERTLWDVAAGGCRTCRNTRTVWNRELLIDTECPTCSPRAEERIRQRLWFRRWPRRQP